MKYFSAIFCALTASVLAFSGCSQSKSIKSFEAMNTFMTIQSWGKGCEKANLAVQKRIDVLEDMLSTTKNNSDIYKLNNSQETEISVHPETFQLLQFSQGIAVKTKGALNPCLYGITSAWGFTTGDYRVPSQDEINFLLKHTDYNHMEFNQEAGTVRLETGMALDLGAVGKGFAGDQAIKILKEQGIKSAILDLGGNVQTLGKKIDGSDWNVGIKDPFGGKAVAGIRISDKAVITSGGYERNFTADDGKSYIHIFDGKTGRPVENDIASVTIVADSGIYGDALSTALFVMGLKESQDYWRSVKDFEFFIINKDNCCFYTEGLEEKLRIIGDFAEITVVE